MRDTSRTLLRLFLALVVTAACSARAASITWGPATTIAGDSDVSASGTLQYAYYWSSATGNQTVNGVTFVRSGSASAGTDVTIAYPNGSTLAAFTSTAAPFTSLSAAYRTVVAGTLYNNSPYSGTLTVTLNNLTVGKLYAVQVWLDDSRGSADSRSATLTSTGGNSVALRYNMQNAAGGVGQYTLGTFTADATTQTFTSASTVHAIFNALQVRDIGTTATPVFNPSAGTYIGAQTVTISSEAGATVFYTTDGSTPSTSSPSGSSPVVVSLAVPASMTIQAFATNSAKANSFTNTAAYVTVGAGSGVWTNLTGGSWTTTPANWLNNAIAAGTNSTADFSTLTLPGDTTVTMDKAWTIGNLLFDDHNATKSQWFLSPGSGGALTLAVSSGTPSVSNNGPATISAVLAGSQGLTKTGNGTLTLTGVNTYSGGTTISSGTLNIGGGGATGTLGSGAVTNNGALIYNLVGTSTGVSLPAAGGLVGNGTLSVTADSITFNGGLTNGGNQVYNATSTGGFQHGGWINAPLTLAATNGASITLSGDFGQNNTTARAFAVDTSNGNGPINLDCTFSRGGVFYSLASFSANAGTGSITWSGTRAASGSQIPVTLTGVINFTSDFLCQTALTMTLNTAGPGTASGAFSGPLSLAKGGASTLTLSGLNNYTGPTTVAAGTLQVDGQIGAGTVTVQSNATLRGIGTIFAPVTVRAGGTLAPGTNSTLGNLSIYNALTNAAGSVTIIRLQPGATPANDQVAGLTGVSYAGTLVVTNITGNSNLFALNDKFTLFAAPAGTYAGSFSSIILPALPGGLSWDASGLTVDGSIAVANVVATPMFNPPAGSNYLTALAVAISSLTTDATIHYTTDGSDPTNSLTVLTGANPVTVNIPVNSSMTLRAYATRSNMLSSATASADYLTWPVRTWTNTLGGSWSDLASWAHNLIGEGSGVTADFSTLTLPADTHVTLDGPRTIGHLRFGDRGAAANWFLDAGFDVLTLDAGSVTPTLTISNQTATIGAPLAGSQGLTKIGNGTLTLAGANTYTGNTVVSGGRLVLTDPAIQSVRDTNTTVSGAVMELDLAADYNKASLNAVIAGNGTLVKRGAGGWSVATTTFAMTGGLIDVQEGMLADANHSTLFTSNLAGLHLATNATAQINGNDWRVDALTGEGTVQLNYINYRSITVGANNGSGTFAGVLNEGSGAAGGYTLSLIKAGTGTEILTGTNTYSGSTTVSGGTLLVNGSLGSNSPVTVQTNATLGGLGTIAGSVTLQNGGTLAPGGSVIGALTTGAETWNAGSVVVCKIAGTNDDSASRDFLAMNGTLNLNALTNATATLKLVSMANSSTPGNVPNFNPAASYTWTIGSATGLTPADPAILNSIVLDSSAFLNAHPAGSFSLGVDLPTGSLQLHYAASAATAPTLGLSTPTNGQFFLAAAALPLAVSVTNTTHSLVQVQYYNNGAMLVATSSTGPTYTANWSGAPVGTNMLTAVLTYDTSLTVTSAPVQVFALGPLSMANLAKVAGGAFQFGITGASGQPFTVRATNVVSAPFASWTVLTNGVIGGGGSVTIIDPNASVNSRQFYRLTSP
jgi:autotransporter-associated beta strand protein